MIHNQSQCRESTIYRTTLPYYMPASANRNYSERKNKTFRRKSIKSRNPKQQKRVQEKRQCDTEMDNYDQRENGRPEGGGLSSSGNDSEVVEEDGDASSSTTGDLAPRMREQFANLSSALVETSENLHTFEFMLGQYREDLFLPSIHLESGWIFPTL